MPARRRAVRRTSRRTVRRTTHRRRRRRRRRIMVGGFVLLAVGGAAYGAVKLSQQDAQRVEQHTGESVEELSEEELVQAMKDLGIQSIELDDNDQAAIAKETGQTPAPQTTATQPAPGEARAEEDYLDELERLADLRDSGVISNQEFEEKKRQILGL